jgi:hypothetical protein
MENVCEPIGISELIASMSGWPLAFTIVGLAAVGIFGTIAFLRTFL